MSKQPMDGEKLHIIHGVEDIRADQLDQVIKILGTFGLTYSCVELDAETKEIIDNNVFVYDDIVETAHRLGRKTGAAKKLLTAIVDNLGYAIHQTPHELRDQTTTEDLSLPFVVSGVYVSDFRINKPIEIVDQNKQINWENYDKVATNAYHIPRLGLRMRIGQSGFISPNISFANANRMTDEDLERLTNIGPASVELIRHLQSR